MADSNSELGWLVIAIMISAIIKWKWKYEIKIKVECAAGQQMRPAAAAATAAAESGERAERRRLRPDGADSSGLCAPIGSLWPNTMLNGRERARVSRNWNAVGGC